MDFKEETLILLVRVGHTRGECKCQNQMATKLPWRPDGVLNCSKQPNGDQNEPFWMPLGRHGHLGHHQVAIWSPTESGSGTCIHLKYFILKIKLNSMMSVLLILTQFTNPPKVAVVLNVWPLVKNWTEKC